MLTANPTFAFLMNQTPMELFKHGGAVMWPVLIVSFLLATIVIERLIFLTIENSRRNRALGPKMLEKVREGEIDEAVALAKGSKDFVARIYAYALTHKETSLEDAYALASNTELSRFSAGLPTLDTCITAAPLLGLLGTVTGMMGTFGALGSGDIGSSAGLITGGVAEALIATASGLLIAVVGLLPFNLLNARVEAVRTDIQNAAYSLTIALKQTATGVRVPEMAPPAIA